MSKGDNENDLTKEIIDFFKDLVIIVIVVKLITMFLVSIFIINGQSMYGSYYDKEFILVDRFSTNTFGGLKEQKVGRGDVVVLEPEVDKDKRFFIKRVIGLGGEELKIENGEVFLKKVGEKSFTKLDEKYLNEDNYGQTRTGKDSIIYKIPEGKFFVMGDNRNHSSDSRSCFHSSCSSTDRDNYVLNDKIVGKVLIDFGYFNYRNFSFTHPNIRLDGEYINTQPKWLSSEDSYIY
ncbi:MAG: signal peptidase I [Candidatus Gracilibacteria bacterium]|nr:signal peptidase I [Candidatus Gracilibacteria bacterium]MDQ7022910.1 signal peptidase I [Candidatus Gracilibacteria bacterium]